VQTRLKLSRKVNECKPLAAGGGGPQGRGLHSLTSQLNLSAFYGIGGARRGCVPHVKGVLGGV